MSLKLFAPIGLMALFVIAGCSTVDPAETPDSAAGAHLADTVFIGGVVYTSNPAQPEAEAIAVEGSKIVFVGSRAEVQSYVGERTEVVEVKDGMILPGFVDSHNHLTAETWIQKGVQLWGAENQEEALSRVREYAESNPDEAIIFGVGWDVTMLGGKPTAKMLDSAVSDRPTFLIDNTIHDGWVNTAALKAGNITAETPDSKPGSIYWERDAEGNPTGLAVEFQWLPPFIAMGGWTPDMIRGSIDELHNVGIRGGMTSSLLTGILSPNLTSHYDHQDDYRLVLSILADMESNNELNIRLNIHPVVKMPNAEADQTADFALELSETYDSDMLMVTGLKIHPETGWSAQGAPMHEAYVGQPDNFGAFAVSPERTMAVVLATNKRGLDISYHAEGTRSTEAIINAFIASKEQGFVNESTRNALHHLLWATPEDQQRIIDNQLSVNSTPQFTTLREGLPAYDSLGEERTEAMFGTYSDLAHKGVRIGLGSDFPGVNYEELPPLYTIQTAVTLVDANQPEAGPFPRTRKPMTIEQAIRAYTIDGAWFMRMEDKIGSLEVGKYADIVVLGADIREVDPMTIKDVEVIATMMNGRFTHRAGQ